MPERGKDSMDALFKDPSNIRTSVIVDIFDANTCVAHQHKEASDGDGEND